MGGRARCRENMKTIKQIKKNLQEGKHDEQFAFLYCRPMNQVAWYRERMIGLLDHYAGVFRREEDSEVAIYSAPGRTELGGNHTDHQRGKVLTGSVDLDALACVSYNETSIVNIYSEGYGMITVDCTKLDLVPAEENTTEALVRGILAKVAEKGYAVSGFNAYIISDVPGGSGLSSSACFEVLIGTAVNGLFCNGKLSMEEIARIGQYAENVYFGKPSGLLDQMGCAMGGIITIDFRNKENAICKAVNFDFAAAGYALCIIDTGADHADLTDEYAAVPLEMKNVAAVFGKEILAEVEEEAFYTNIPLVREKTGDRAVLRTIHYYNDCKRVEQQVKALECNDFDTFLKLVKESGASSFMYLQNVETFRDRSRQPVAIALAFAEHFLDGKGAFRVHGGGFAGTIQAFVPLDDVAEFKAGMDAIIGNGACRITYIRPVGGYAFVE